MFSYCGIKSLGRVLLVAVVIATCLVLTGCSESETGKSTVYVDGVYEGKALGYNANITVMVTVAEDRITDVTVVSHADDDPYWTNSQRVIEDIVSSGSTEVDAVSGATYSSQGIIKAVEDALSKALK